VLRATDIERTFVVFGSFGTESWITLRFAIAVRSTVGSAICEGSSEHQLSTSYRPILLTIRAKATVAGFVTAVLTAFGCAACRVVLRCYYYAKTQQQQAEQPRAHLHVGCRLLSNEGNLQ
jgi:hypothetical protein